MNINNLGYIASSIEPQRNAIFYDTLHNRPHLIVYYMGYITTDKPNGGIVSVLSHWHLDSITDECNIVELDALHYSGRPHMYGHVLLNNGKVVWTNNYTYTRFHMYDLFNHTNTYLGQPSISGGIHSGCIDQNGNAWFTSDTTTFFLVKVTPDGILTDYAIDNPNKTKSALREGIDILSDNNYLYILMEDRNQDNNQPNQALINIQGLSRSNPCRVTWTNHGLNSDNTVYIQGITQSEWTTLNNQYYEVIYVDDNNFTLEGVNTAEYSEDYNAELDNGQIRLRFPAWYVNVYNIETGEYKSFFKNKGMVISGQSIYIRKNDLNEIYAYVNLPHPVPDEYYKICGFDTPTPVPHTEYPPATNKWYENPNIEYDPIYTIPCGLPNSITGEVELKTKLIDEDWKTWTGPINIYNIGASKVHSFSSLNTMYWSTGISYYKTKGYYPTNLNDLLKLLGYWDSSDDCMQTDYTMTYNIFNKKFYISGYTATICEFDPTLPWYVVPTLPAQNPKKLSGYNTNGCQYFRQSTTANNGIVAFMGDYEGSDQTGTTIIFYDPTTLSWSSLRNANLPYIPDLSLWVGRQLTSVCGGQKILYSISHISLTSRSRLLLIDPNTKKVKRRYLPINTNNYLRFVDLHNIYPNRVLVFSKDNPTKACRLNLSNGKVEWSTTLPSGVIFNTNYWYEETMPIGPDNLVYFILDNNIKTIDPANGNINDPLHVDSGYPSIFGRYTFDSIIYNTYGVPTPIDVSGYGTTGSLVWYNNTLFLYGSGYYKIYSITDIG
jgi:hypothetical protein